MIYVTRLQVFCAVIFGVVSLCGSVVYVVTFLWFWFTIQVSAYCSYGLRVYNFAVSTSKSVNNLRFYLAVNGLHVYKLLPLETRRRPQFLPRALSSYARLRSALRAHAACLLAQLTEAISWTNCGNHLDQAPGASEKKQRRERRFECAYREGKFSRFDSLRYRLNRVTVALRYTLSVVTVAPRSTPHLTEQGKLPCSFFIGLVPLSCHSQSAARPHNSPLRSESFTSLRPCGCATGTQPTVIVAKGKSLNIACYALFSSIMCKGRKP